MVKNQIYRSLPKGSECFPRKINLIKGRGSVGWSVSIDPVTTERHKFEPCLYPVLFISTDHHELYQFVCYLFCLYLAA